MATYKCPVFQENGFYYITSQYGPRVNPVTKKEQFHSGVDLVRLLDDGSHDIATIVAIEAGTVRNVAYTDSNGYYVDLVHTSGRRTLYLHLQKDSIPSYVKIGAVVNQGAKIGTMGSTGNSTGAHLHFQVYDTDGTTIIDPMPFIAGININYEKNATLCPIVKACKQGDRNTDVAALQRKLAQISPEYEKDIKSHSVLKNPITFDGIYGAKLAKLVSDFQTKMGLYATGNCDEETARILNLSVFDLVQKLTQINETCVL